MGNEQTNYFSYNIIDTLYFNQPVGQSLVDVYGIDASFTRRNADQYDKMSDDQKREFDEKEKKFIQAVISKYTIDNYTGTTRNDKGTYIGHIKPVEDLNGEYNQIQSDVTFTYFNNKNEVGIELSDMLSNINGTHNYKLISAKDIDFDNVILPNSLIESNFNWGEFDINRRWGDKPIRINNTFELLNVIDYLLCACNNLWNELYKIKYNVNSGVDIWFAKDVSEYKLIHSSSKLVTQDFQLNSEGRTDDTKMITYLNPFNYYTSLNNNVDNNFGIVTNFYTTLEDGNLYFDRKIVDVRNHNIILMTINPPSKEIKDYVSSITQNVNGELQQIYSYKIGDELKIYPGSRIDAFINESNVKTNPNELVDFINKRLKKEIYFKSDIGHSVYSKVYIKFLDEGQFSISTTDPYLLYYITTNNEKMIISANYSDSQKLFSNELYNALQSYIRENNILTYKIFNYETNSHPSQVLPNGNGNKSIPKFYVIPDEFFSTLEVATPNSKIFSAGSKSLTIYYYKNSNELKCQVVRVKNIKDEQNQDQELEIEIKPENDITQRQSISYHGFRYNIPDGHQIRFKFDATYIASDNTSEGNPLGLKLDDEYYDMMLYDYQNVINDEIAAQYYRLIDIDGESPYKRNFVSFTKDTFDGNIENYMISDDTGKQYKHIWKQQENPYKLNLTVDNDEFITQSISKDQANTEIQKILTLNDQGQNEFILSTYNLYEFNHTLTEGIEQVKMDLRFSIDETSKVKGIECVIPININKIYNPTINYYTKPAVTLENKKYSNIYYTTADNNNEVQLSAIYNAIANKYSEAPVNGQLDSIPDIGKYMYGELSSLDELETAKTYNCITNNSFFEFTYSDTANIVNLIGSWYTDKYVSTYIKNGKSLADIKLTVNDNTYILKKDREGGQQHATANNHPYIFNINGLGKNYRLHGGGNFIHPLWGKLNSNSLGKTEVRQFHSQFDLLSVSTFNSNVSFNKQLQIKLNDGGNQLTYIGVSKEGNSVNWTSNETPEFNEGFIIGQQESNYGTQSNFETGGDYQIKTIPIDITKISYLVNCDIKFDTSDNRYMTYYVPITYMTINSSTFYPPIDLQDPNNSTLPSGKVPDLNDETEKIKYHNYVECWKSEDYYKPITMSLKLFDNTTVTSPYYYESNEAVMKFNIKRADGPQQVSIGGTESIIYVALKSRYYLSDFVHVGSTSTSDIPSGSYFYYNDNYHCYDIGEIRANFADNKFSTEHNSHYNYYEGSELIKLRNPDNSMSNKKVPYPIFNKKIEEDGQISFSSTLYDYDIYRISDINKLNFSKSPIFTKEVIYIQSENTERIEWTSEIEAEGIEPNESFFFIDFTDSFKNNFGENKKGRYHSFNMILLTIDPSGIIGSKNRKGALLNAKGPQTIIAPIIRQKLVSNPEDGEHFEELDLYSTAKYNPLPQQTENGVTYEFFEFKYENVYEIKKVTEGNSQGEWVIESIAPTLSLDREGSETIENSDSDYLSCKQAYDKQLELFLLNSRTDFIGTMEYFQNYYGQDDNEEEQNEG